MAEVVPVRLKGKLKEVVDTLVSTGVYGSKSEVIRSGIRRIGEEHGLIPKGARYHIRELQSMVLEKSPEETMERLEKISDEIWEKRKKLYT
ncbi:MAG: type II toxin-antitoxin system ParD family antitoxin [Candidatus Hydrothermarchaeales archaeon]